MGAVRNHSVLRNRGYYSSGRNDRNRTLPISGTEAGVCSSMMK